jgi:hypothetical protein
VAALGAQATALVNLANALAESQNRFVPEVLVAGGGGAGAIEGLAAVLARLAAQRLPAPPDNGS